MDHLDPKLDGILVILPSTHSPTGIFIPREDNTLELMFLAHK